MSLLLDALKKAALEKQRREQPNSVKAPAPDALAPSTPPAPAEPIPPVVMAVADTNTSLGSHDLGGLNPQVFDEIRADPPEPDSEPLTTETVISHPTLEQHEEGLFFDFSEIDPQYLLSPESVEEPASLAVNAAIEEGLVGAEQLVGEEGPGIGEEKSIVDEFVRKASTLATPVNCSPLTMAPMPDSRLEVSEEAALPSLQEAKNEQSDFTAPPPITTPVSAPTETSSAQPVEISSASVPVAAAQDDVETFNAAAGKAALAQLLERSKKAAGAARKRMVLMYGILSIIAVVLVVFYYYLLHSSSTSAVALPPAEIPASGEVAEVTPATAVLPTVPSAVGGTITPQANLTVEEESPAPPLEQAPFAEQSTREEPPTQTEQNSTPQRATRKRQHGEEDYSASSVSLPPERAIKQAMIVEHKAEENAVSEAIARGYNAYRAGDLEGAGAAYREALGQDPYQRDALLGAAAVAVREGRQTDALTLYQKRLARDPKDEYAQAGILALSASPDQNPQLESELSRLLLEYPEAAHLHFLKGSLYATRQQWAAAQLAFFEAWQRDNKNPDLAFNLAVAMDHLNQPKEAARFYRQAIDLGNTRSVGFSVDATLRRLQTLEQQPVQEGATP